MKIRAYLAGNEQLSSKKRAESQSRRSLTNDDMADPEPFCDKNQKTKSVLD